TADRRSLTVSHARTCSRRSVGVARSARRLVRVATPPNRPDTANSRGFWHRPTHGHDSLARVGSQHHAISIVVFGSGAGGSFLPQKIAGALRSRRGCHPYLRVYTRGSERLAQTTRPH